MRSSIGTGIVLIAMGAIVAFAVRAPGEVEKYIDVLDLGLILIWSGILVLIMQVWMHRPPRRRPPVVRRRESSSYGESYEESYEDPWETHDVHRPGYAGETQRLPTVRRTTRDG